MSGRDRATFPAIPFDGRDQNRNRSLGASTVDINTQILLICRVWIRVEYGIGFLVVVTKLNENVVIGDQRILNGSPLSFIVEAFRTATRARLVVHYQARLKI